jgi:hypothetical protein
MNILNQGISVKFDVLFVEADLNRIKIKLLDLYY